MHIESIHPDMDYHVNRNLHIHEEIRELITQKNYPCVATVQSVARNDYLIGVYSDFGTSKITSVF